MNKKIRKALKYQNFPLIQFQAKEASILFENQKDRNEELQVLGTLSIAGKKQEVQLEMEGKMTEKERFFISWEYNMKMSDFDIDPPTAMFGQIVTGDEINIVFDLMLSPSLLSAKAYIDGADTIKIGLVGCGGRGSGAAVQALSTKQNVKLVAIGDAFKDKVEESYKNIQSALEDSDISMDRLAVSNDSKFAGFDAYKKVIDQCTMLLS